MNAAKWQINTGEEVIHMATGRIGHAVQVRTTEVYIRFAAGQKVATLPRASVMPTRTLEALREVDEDEANAKAYRER